jgi:hypothetical protein
LEEAAALREFSSLVLSLSSPQVEASAEVCCRRLSLSHRLELLLAVDDERLLEEDELLGAVDFAAAELPFAVRAAAAPVLLGAGVGLEVVAAERLGELLELRWTGAVLLFCDCVLISSSAYRLSKPFENGFRAVRR